MSRSQFQSKRFILRHAWLNLWDERMTTGRINQVATLIHQRARRSTIKMRVDASNFINRSKLPWLAGFWWALILLINIVHECTLWVSFQVPFQTYPGTSCVQQLHINATPVHGGSLCRVTRWFPTTGTVKRSFPESEFWLMLRKAKQ